MFKELSFNLLTQMLNKMIQSDPFALDYLVPLAHKSMRLIVLKTPVDLWIQFYANSIEIKAFQAQDKATITLSGAPSDLLKFAKTHEHTRLLMEKNVKIDGELDVLLDIKRLQEELAIDWESLLAEQLGDFTANRLMTLGKSLHDKVRYQLRRTCQHVEDYLRHETTLVVQRKELEQFSQQSLMLRREIDRIDARIKRIEHKKH
jgi:ubiquinone biosynthesis protein UbiJ